MIRTPESTIKQAILHPVEEIRTTALDYFSLSYTSDESLMPVVIQAVEQYGRDATFDLLRDAENLPQTEATVRWICDELAKDWHIEDVAIDNYCFALGLLLCKTRVDLLRPEMAELRSFPVELAERFQERIEMASWDWNTIWAALEYLGEEAHDHHQGGDHVRLQPRGRRHGAVVPRMVRSGTGCGGGTSGLPVSSVRARPVPVGGRRHLPELGRHAPARHLRGRGRQITGRLPPPWAG